MTPDRQVVLWGLAIAAVVLGVAGAVLRNPTMAWIGGMVFGGLLIKSKELR